MSKLVIKKKDLLAQDCEIFIHDYKMRDVAKELELGEDSNSNTVSFRLDINEIQIDLEAPGYMDSLFALFDGNDPF